MDDRGVEKFVHHQGQRLNDEGRDHHFRSGDAHSPSIE
jgi:hypothetical protein